MQIQQIHDVEPVSTNMPEIRQDQEGEASQWINAHIMELSAAYGVAFEGFREETPFNLAFLWNKHLSYILTLGNKLPNGF